MTCNVSMMSCSTAPTSLFLKGIAYSNKLDRPLRAVQEPPLLVAFRLDYSNFTLNRCPRQHLPS
jgi:hypothetical protein